MTYDLYDEMNSINTIDDLEGLFLASPAFEVWLCKHTCSGDYVSDGSSLNIRCDGIY